MAARAFSGLQKQVFSLYRACMRGVRSKPESERADLREYVRAEFNKGKSLSPKDIQRIEHMLRHGKKMLVMLMAPGARMSWSRPSNT
eukprot:XP_001693672.1 LYR protein [Chlamydomonas reinhardtii]